MKRRRQGFADASVGWLGNSWLIDRAIKPVHCVMVSASGAVTAVTPVPVARIVMVLVPSGVAAVVVSCNVVVAPVPVLGFGVNVAVTPAGRFSAAKVTSPLKLVRARAMVVVELALRAMVSAAGVSVNPMLAGGGAAVIVIGSVAV